MQQIVAKTGGAPWSKKDIPGNDVPTLTVGIDVFHKKGYKSVAAYVATLS